MRPKRGTSRGRLLVAGLELLAESSRGDLSNVLTATAVADRADLSRQTFYLHWKTQGAFVEDVIDYVTDPSRSASTERLATLADEVEDISDDPSADVRRMSDTTFNEWLHDPVNVARMVLWGAHANDERVSRRLRELYRSHDDHAARAFKVIGDEWGIEPRPPFTYDTAALLVNSLRDGLLLHLSVDSSRVPDKFIEDAQLALTLAITRRIDEDTETLDEAFQRRVGRTDSP